MKPDLKSMTRKQLEKLSADIDTALARVSKKELKLARAAAEKAAKAHGFTLAEVLPAGSTQKGSPTKAAKTPNKPGVPKFANPDDKTQTWTGKGRRPGWFLAAMQSGKSPDELAI